MSGSDLLSLLQAERHGSIDILRVNRAQNSTIRWWRASRHSLLNADDLPCPLWVKTRHDALEFTTDPLYPESGRCPATDGRPLGARTEEFVDHSACLHELLRSRVPQLQSPRTHRSRNRFSYRQNRAKNSKNPMRCEPMRSNYPGELGTPERVERAVLDELSRQADLEQLKAHFRKAEEVKLCHALIPDDTGSQTGKIPS
jgi:hypothetical protein